MSARDFESCEWFVLHQVYPIPFSLYFMQHHEAIFLFLQLASHFKPSKPGLFTTAYTNLPPRARAVLIVLPASCYLTSTIVYGYTGALSNPANSRSINQTFSAIWLPSTSAIVTTIPPATPPSLSSLPGVGSLSTFLGSSAEQSLVSEKSSELSGVPLGRTTTSSTGSTALASPASPLTATTSPTSSEKLFYISIDVNTATSKLRKRAVYYIGFSDDDGILVDSKSVAALFQLVNGYLMSGGEFAGAASSTGYSSFEKFSAPPADAQAWSLDSTAISFGNATFCEASDMSVYIVLSSAPPFTCGEVVPAVVLASSVIAILTTSESSRPTLTSSETYATSPMAPTTPQTAATALPMTMATSSKPNGPLSKLSSMTAVGTSSKTIVSSTVLAISQTIHSTSTTASSALSSVVYSSTTTLTRSAATTSTVVQASPSTVKPTTSAVAMSANSIMSSVSSSQTAQTTTAAVQTTSSASQTTNPAVPTMTSPVMGSVPSATTIQPGSGANFVSSTANMALSSTISIKSSTTILPTIAASSSTIAAIAQTTTTTSMAVVTPTTIMAQVTTTTQTTTTVHTTTGAQTITTTTTTTSLKTSTASAAPSFVRNTGKRGLAYTNVTLTKLYSLSGQNSQVSWAYDYYSLPNASDNAGTTNPALTYVPLLFNDANTLTSIWAANVNYSIANYGTDSVLAFNEPDGCPAGESACMSVAASVAGYQTYIQPFAGRVLLGAPAVTNTGPPAGLTYLSYFLGNCTGCTIDFVPIHWYASPYSFPYLQQYVQQAYAAGGNRPIWITELGMDSQNYLDADVQKFMKNATTWLDAQSYVMRYSWFGDFTMYLVNPAGTALSAQGVIWNSWTGGYVYS